MKKETIPIKRRKPTEERQKELINAALKILSSEGSRNFTAERLGQAVGMASGSIFRHFDSMEDILDGIVDRIEEVIFAEFPPKAENPLEALRIFFEARVRAITDYPEISRLLLHNTLIPNSHGKNREQRLNGFKVKSRKFVNDCLKKAQDENLLADDISNEESAIFVYGIIYAFANMNMTQKSKKEKQAMIQRVWHILERSLKKSKTS